MFKIIKNDIKNLLISPKSIAYIGFSNNLKLLFYYYLFLFLLLSFCSICISSLSHFFPNQPQPFISKKIIFLEVSLIVPVIEEIIFRLLIRIKKLNLILFFIFLIAYLFYEMFIITEIFYVMIVIFVLLLIFYKNFNFNINSSQFNNNNYMLFIVYTSSIIFGLFHITNFEVINPINIIIIGYVFSKVLGGFAFALLRLKFGIIASILFHIFLNSFAYILVTAA